MRILLLANHFNTGGITTYLLTLVKGYVARGHEVFVATSGGECVAKAEASGARHILAKGLGVKCEFHPGLLSSALKLSRAIREHDIDVLHAQTRVTQSVAAMAGSLAQRPYVSTCHGFFRPHAGRLLFPLWGVRVIAISGAVARHLAQDLRARPGLIDVVYNGVDAGRFKPADASTRKALRERFGIDETAPLVGMVARLSDVKGHACLIQAMQELPHRMPGVRCLIVGEGPLEDQLKARVAELHLEGSVSFVPIGGQPADLLGMFDVVAVPSVQEGLGLSAMEAQACGIPVVASRVGGLPEVISDQETGALVPPGDPVALADALLEILADKDLAARLGAAGRERISSMFSIDGMIEGTLAVYKKAVMPHA